MRFDLCEPIEEIKARKIAEVDIEVGRKHAALGVGPSRDAAYKIKYEDAKGLLADGGECTGYLIEEAAARGLLPLELAGQIVAKYEAWRQAVIEIELWRVSRKLAIENAQTIRDLTQL